MFNAIWVLSKARLLILRNSFRRGSLRSKIGMLLLLVVLGMAAFALYGVSRTVAAGLRSDEFAALLAEVAVTTPGLPSDLGPYLAAVPGAALFGALVLLVLSSFSSLLNTLYLSGDIDMLLVAPVPMRAVFSVKFFAALSMIYAILLGVLGPALIGYGQGLGYGFAYVLGALLVLLLLPLIPAGLSALLVMGVVRVVPARRARELVGILGGLVGVLFYIVSQFTGEIGAQVDSGASLGVLLSSNFPLLPSAWAGQALVALGEGQFARAGLFGGLFVLVSLGVFAGCLVLAERLYYDGWSNLSNEAGRGPRVAKRSRNPNQLEQVATTILQALPGQSRAILFKDVRLFVRDLRNLQQIIFPLALAGIWIFRLFADPPDPALADELPAWLGTLNNLASVGIVYYICVALSSALAGNGISREGRSLWILKLAPVSALQLLLGKLALAYLPYPLVGPPFLLLLSIISGGSVGDFLLQLGILLLAGFGSAAIPLGLGAAFPRLDWENPQQQQTFRAGCLSGLLLPLYLALVMLLIGGSGALGAFLGGPAILGLSLIGWVLAIVLTFGICAGMLAIGVRGVERIEL